MEPLKIESDHEPNNMLFTGLTNAVKQTRWADYKENSSSDSDTITDIVANKHKHKRPKIVQSPKPKPEAIYGDDKNIAVQFNNLNPASVTIPNPPKSTSTKINSRWNNYDSQSSED